MKFFLMFVIFLCHFSELIAAGSPYDIFEERPTWDHHWGYRLKHRAMHVSKIAVAIPVVPVTTIAGAGLGVLSIPIGAMAGVLVLDFRLYGPQPEQTKYRIFRNACKGAWSGFSTYTKDGAKFGWECADATVDKMTHLF